MVMCDVLRPPCATHKACDSPQRRTSVVRLQRLYCCACDRRVSNIVCSCFDWPLVLLAAAMLVLATMLLAAAMLLLDAHHAVNGPQDLFHFADLCLILKIDGCIEVGDLHNASKHSHSREYATLDCRHSLCLLTSSPCTSANMCHVNNMLRHVAAMTHRLMQRGHHRCQCSANPGTCVASMCPQDCSQKTG